MQNLITQDYLMHHGIKGMKWGVRHNPERSMRGNFHRGLSRVYSLNAKTYKKLGNNALASMNTSARNQQLKKAEIADKSNKPLLTPKQKKVAKKVAIGAAVVAGAGLATYGGYKISKHNAYKNSKAIDSLLRNNWDIRAQEVTKYTNGNTSNIATYGWNSLGSQNAYAKLLNKQKKNLYYRSFTKNARKLGDYSVYY